LFNWIDLGMQDKFYKDIHPPGGDSNPGTSRI